MVYIAFGKVKQTRLFHATSKSVRLLVLFVLDLEDNH